MHVKYNSIRQYKSANHSEMIDSLKLNCHQIFILYGMSLKSVVVLKISYVGLTSVCTYM